MVTDWYDDESEDLSVAEFLFIGFILVCVIGIEKFTAFLTWPLRKLKTV